MTIAVYAMDVEPGMTKGGYTVKDSYPLHGETRIVFTYLDNGIEMEYSCVVPDYQIIEMD